VVVKKQQLITLFLRVLNRRAETEAPVCPADHPWIKEDGEAPDTPLDNAVMNRLKQFKAMNQFKKAALRVRVYFLPDRPPTDRSETRIVG
jgi:hypothetical protein